MRDFAAMVRAHLDDRVAMLRAEIEQRQRDADVVVEIPLRDQAGSHPAQDRADHFLGRRLPVAAGHGDHRAPKPPAMFAGARGQRPQRVGHDDLRQVDWAARARPADRRRPGPPRRSRTHGRRSVRPEARQTAPRPAGSGCRSRCNRTTRSSPTRRPSPQRARPASVSGVSESVSIREAFKLGALVATHAPQSRVETFARRD